MDVVWRFKSSSHPIRNIIKDIIKVRMLNSRARREMSDAAFDWCRFRNLAEAFFIEQWPRFATFAEQKKEEFILALLLDATQADAQLLSQDIVKDYLNYCQVLGDKRYLVALGPVLRAHLEPLADGEAIAKGLFGKAKTYVAIDNRKIALDEVKRTLDDCQITWRQSAIFPDVLELTEKFAHNAITNAFGDKVWIMDAGSQFVAKLIEPAARERILDMCVGEGQKLKLLCHEGVQITAVDISARRLAIAKQRNQGEGIRFVCTDAAALDATLGLFDWILLDAPCSGSGTIRRHPDLILRLTQATLNTYLAMQRSLIDSAIKSLAPNGKLIYATCSVLPIENSLQVAEKLAVNCTMKPSELSALGNANNISLLPHIHDCDGFFLSVWKRNQD